MEGTVAAGLAVGAAFVVLFSLMFGDSGFSPQESSFVTIVIPEGASLESSEKSYEPNYARLFLGTNNTVRWVNQDVSAHSVVSDSDFESDLLVSGQSFEHTFTSIGSYHYYGVPGPHLRGLIEVYPELQKDLYVNVSVNGLKSTYRVGEPVTFVVAVEGHGTNCNSFEATIEDKDAPDFGYSAGSIPGCTYPDSFRDFSEQITIGTGGEWFSPAYINQTGTYLLTVSYEMVQFPGVRDSVEIEFEVAD